MTDTDDFSDAERDAVYRVIASRRDVRSQFVPTPVPSPVLRRILAAAHAAPSVGFSQPWDFLVLEDRPERERVKADFDRQNAAASRRYEEERRTLYRSLKLEGILDAPLNVCVTCDRDRGGPNVLGRNSAIDADRFSTCLAVQNLWLAARAEGVGVGWVSILDHAALCCGCSPTSSRRVPLCRVRQPVSTRAGVGNGRLGSPRAARRPHPLRPLGRPP